MVRGGQAREQTRWSCDRNIGSYPRVLQHKPDHLSLYSVSFLTNMRVDLLVCFVAAKRSEVRVIKRAQTLSRRTGGVRVRLGRIGLRADLKVESCNSQQRNNGFMKQSTLVTISRVPYASVRLIAINAMDYLSNPSGPPSSSDSD